MDVSTCMGIRPEMVDISSCDDDDEEEEEEEEEEIQ